MAITKIQSESLNLSDTYDFTGTVTGAGGVNTPAFHATINSAQTLTHDNITKLAFASEVFDTNNVYDTSNYRFTPGVIGKYILGVGFWTYDSANSMTTNAIYFYKNGSAVLHGMIRVTSANYQRNWITAVGVVDADATGDYFEVYARPEQGDAGTVDVSATSDSGKRNYFYGYKLIT